MLVACWSPKGGSGTTVVSVALAAVLGRWDGGGRGALLVDLAGDVPAALGLPDSCAPGVGDWLAAGADVPEDALARLEIDAGPRVRVLPAGARPAATRAGSERGPALAALLAADGRPVVADCGRAGDEPQPAVAAGATVSVLVVRPCYLALKRALAAPVGATGVVVVEEPQRALGFGDVEEVLGLPVLARVPFDPGVARAVDAGLLGRALPRRLDRSLRPLAADLLGPRLRGRSGRGEPPARSAWSRPCARRRPLPGVSGL